LRRRPGVSAPRPRNARVLEGWRDVAVHTLAHVAQSRCASDKPCQSAGEGVVRQLPQPRHCEEPATKLRSNFALERRSNPESFQMVIPGRCASIEPGISRFRVWRLRAIPE